MTNFTDIDNAYRKITARAVSYTHLDVYKRQTLEREVNAINIVA